MKCTSKKKETEISSSEPKKFTIKDNPRIDNVLDVSTAHITCEDSNILCAIVQGAEVLQQRGMCPVIAQFFSIIDHGYGYFILAVKLDIPAQRMLHLAGASESLVNLIHLAHDLGCKWLCLDSDGVVYEDLPQHDW